MRTQIVHMESNNASNYLAFLRYETIIKDRESREYYIKKCNALWQLVWYVADNELTANQRKVFELVMVQGNTSKKASEILGVEPSTVCRHLKAVQSHMDKAYEHFKCVEHHLLGDVDDL